MTVSELIKELENFPKDIEVLFEDQNSILRDICGVEFNAFSLGVILNESNGHI